MLKSKLKDVRIPDDVSLTHFVLDEIHKYGDDVAFIDSTSEKQLTFTELHKQVRAVGSALYRRGLRKGDVVLLFAPNCVEYPVMFHAVVGQGAIISTCNPLYTAGELVEQLQDSKTVYIFTHPMFLSKVEEARNNYKNIREVFVSGQAPGCVSFSELCSDDGSAYPEVTINPLEDIAVLPYSSGTTGKPKGVMLTHYSMVANCCQFVCPEIGLDERHRYIAFMPFFHIYGIVGFNIINIRYGCTSTIMPRFDLEKMLTIIQKFKPTYLHTVPPICVALAKSPLVDKYDMSSIRGFFCGAAPLSKNIGELMKKRFPHARTFQQGYGMTELSPVAMCSLPGAWNCSSSGVLLPRTLAKVVDIVTGKTQGPHQDGEICIKGPQVMKGYLARPQATADTIDKDGWLHTGDIGHYDENEHFYIVDRLKELIKFRAYQVPPAELESLLLKHAEVADAAVIGVPDEEAGELPRAYIVRKPDCSVNEEALSTYVAEHVAPYKKLRGGVFFVDQIPKSASGKILRRILKDQVLGEVAGSPKTNPETDSDSGSSPIQLEMDRAQLNKSRAELHEEWAKLFRERAAFHAEKADFAAEKVQFEKEKANVKA